MIFMNIHHIQVGTIPRCVPRGYTSDKLAVHVNIFFIFLFIHRNGARSRSTRVERQFLQLPIRRRRWLGLPTQYSPWFLTRKPKKTRYRRQKSPGLVEGHRRNRFQRSIYLKGGCCRSNKYLLTRWPSLSLNNTSRYLSMFVSIYFAKTR